MTTLLGGILTACGNSKPTAFAQKEFNLGEKQFSINLPIGAEIQISDDKNMVMMQLQPGTRNSPSITMRMTFSGDSQVEAGQTASIGKAGRLAYKVSMASQIGSGGPEAFLNGQLALGNGRYVVSCAIQSEYVTIDQASWCIDYLSTLVVR